MFFVIKVGSITNAQRGMKLLRSKGYRASVQRLQNPQPSDGCGYVIKVVAESETQAVSIIKNAGITVLGVEVE